MFFKNTIIIKIIVLFFSFQFLGHSMMIERGNKFIYPIKKKEDNQVYFKKPVKIKAKIPKINVELEKTSLYDIGPQGLTKKQEIKRKQILKEQKIKIQKFIQKLRLKQKKIRMKRKFRI
jgi:hypothetical protein